MFFDISPFIIMKLYAITKPQINHPSRKRNTWQTRKQNNSTAIPLPYNHKREDDSLYIFAVLLFLSRLTLAFSVAQNTKGIHLYITDAQLVRQPPSATSRMTVVIYRSKRANRDWRIFPLPANGRRRSFGHLRQAGVWLVPMMKMVILCCSSPLFLISVWHCINRQYILRIRLNTSCCDLLTVHAMRQSWEYY